MRDHVGDLYRGYYGGILGVEIIVHMRGTT